MPIQAQPKPSAVIFAKSPTTLAHFYAQVAQMVEIHRDEGHIVLEAGGFELVLHALPEQIAAEIHITMPPQIREDTPIKLCWPVDSLALARRTAASLGGQMGAETQQWQARGFRACDGYDPEGNVFQLREAAD